MTGIYQYQAYEPFGPAITPLANVDTVCLPAIKVGCAI